MYSRYLEAKAFLVVEKRTYKPAGWKHLREVDVVVRLTAKRAEVTAGPYGGRVFSRETGQEIQPRDHLIGQSIRYSLRVSRMNEGNVTTP